MDQVVSRHTRFVSLQKSVDLLFRVPLLVPIETSHGVVWWEISYCFWLRWRLEGLVSINGSATFWPVINRASLAAASTLPENR